MEVLIMAGLGTAVVLLAAGFAYSLRERLCPRMFAQATVLRTNPGEGSAEFRLFDGKMLKLTVDRKALGFLHVGDYGRLTWQGKRFEAFRAE